tara:strand:+ start:2152 stop:2868 length:717 start_codon:yes stop_codon:yes gene_type:complete
MIKKHEAPLVYANYKRITKKILSVLKKEQHDKTTLNVLDWGGHDGVLSQLLIKNGIKNVHLYDVGDELPPFDNERFPLLNEVTRSHSTDVVSLPFDNDQFDVVLSVGVLEHVPFMSDSLKELHRILKPNGLLFIFHFPNRYSWSEWLAARHRLSGHARKLSSRELHLQLVTNGYDVERHWRFNFLPKTLYPLPSFILKFVSIFTPIIYVLDAIFSQIPFLNQLANSNECYAKATNVLR